METVKVRDDKSTASTRTRTGSPTANIQPDRGAQARPNAGSEDHRSGRPSGSGKLSSPIQPSTKNGCTETATAVVDTPATEASSSAPMNFSERSCKMRNSRRERSAASALSSVSEQWSPRSSSTSILGHRSSVLTFRPNPPNFLGTSFPLSVRSRKASNARCAVRSGYLRIGLVKCT